MYKYKSASDKYDMPALLNNRLWVSTLENMNDPMDLGFYIKGSKYSDSQIRSFQDALNKAFVIISLGKTVQNRRLWNYYTDGMKGFALKYENNDLESALKALGAKSVISGSVDYKGEKTETTDLLRTYLDSGELPTVKQAELLFKKDTSWQSEDEFRIITRSDFLTHHIGAEEKGGIHLEKVIPTQIVIGYKMDTKKEEQLLDYAEKQNIEVRKFTPDFRKKRSKDFKSELIHAKKKMGSETTEEPELDDVTITDDEFDKLLEMPRYDIHTEKIPGMENSYALVINDLNEKTPLNK